MLTVSQFLVLLQTLTADGDLTPLTHTHTHTLALIVSHFHAKAELV